MLNVAPIAEGAIITDNAYISGQFSTPYVTKLREHLEKRDLGVKLALERVVRLVCCADGRLEIGLEQGTSKNLVHELTRKFTQWTNRPWTVVVSAQESQPTVKAQHEARKAELKSGVRADPLVQAVLARFPGAEIVDVRKGGAPASARDQRAD